MFSKFGTVELPLKNVGNLIFNNMATLDIKGLTKWFFGVNPVVPYFVFYMPMFPFFSIFHYSSGNPAETRKQWNKRDKGEK